MDLRYKIFKHDKREMATNFENDRFFKSSDHSVILQLRNVTKLYPGTLALNRVNLHFRAGEIHGIIGKNGAGKTTLMGIISGIIVPTEGDLFIKGRHFKFLSRKRAKREGISIVTQEPQIIPDFSVMENLFSPDFICSWGWRINWREIHTRAQQILQQSNLPIRPEIKASDLTLSEQQLLLVLKACYVENSNMIILDEVTASLSQKDQTFLYEMIRRQKEDGKTILFISHRLGEILEICDRVSVLRDGMIVATEDRFDLNGEKLSRLIVGQERMVEIKKEDDLKETSEAREEVIRVEGLTRKGFFENISFYLKRGEILGLAGLRGSGRTEILKTIAGIDLSDEGTIRIGNHIKKFTKPAQAYQWGIVYLPEDRDREGLIEILSVKMNLTLSSLRSLTKKILIAKGKEERVSRELLHLLLIQTPSVEQEIRYLSGGNRQKTVVGKILATNPRVFLLDEPTKGIDIAAKKTILETIRKKLTQSAGVILTSPGLEDLISVCDRILVLYQGKIVREFLKGEFQEKEIYLAMQGVNLSSPLD